MQEVSEQLTALGAIAHRSIHEGVTKHDFSYLIIADGGMILFCETYSDWSVGCMSVSGCGVLSVPTLVATEHSGTCSSRVLMSNGMVRYCYVY
jgi:hypothetical protein